MAAAAEVVVAPFGPPEAVAEAAPAATAPAAGEGEATAAAPETAVAVPDTVPDAATAQPEAPEVLIVDAGGVRKQAPAAPVTALVIDTIGYGANGVVQIAGRAEPDGFARLYLDNAEVATVPISDAGLWQAELADVAPGVYTLRADRVDGTGKVTSRFETPFQRETPEVVAAAMASGTATSGESASAETAPAGTAPAGTAPAGSAPAGTAPAPSAPAETAPAGTAPANPNSAAPAPSGSAEPVATAAASDAGVAARPETAAPAGSVAPQAGAVEPAPASGVATGTRAAIVTVQPGFTLWRIARENYGDGVLYVKVFEANKDQIRDPDLIYPGQIFTVPAE
ncbi:MAG: LysM peptidoglycan-binding domain-containing protein [Defluviimonas sp.]|nr:LysM peptidoglycan-binding domain-containing protein [Defluviimonas sp.]